MIKIGINGFGRIGRLVFRAAICADDIEVVAVNAPDKTPEQLAYTVKYDSVHGRFHGTVDCEGGENPALIVNGKRVALLNNRDAKLLPWGELGVEYVLECTGAFLTKEKAQDHLDAGAQVVVLSGPSKDDTPMFVCGVNLDAYTPDFKIVSNDTATQQVVDGFSKKNWRLSRGVHGNIIPTSTGAAKAVGKVIPALQGKLTGTSMRIPSADVSIVDLTCRLEKAATYDEICAAVKAAAEGPMAGVVEYVDDEVVSSDFITDPHTSIFDAKAGLALNDHFVKLMAWYDNEWGFSNKMLDLTRHIDSVRKA